MGNQHKQMSPPKGSIKNPSPSYPAPLHMLPNPPRGRRPVGLTCPPIRTSPLSNTPSVRLVASTSATASTSLATAANTPNIPSGFALGTAVDVMHGLSPSWSPSDSRYSLFTNPPSTPLVTTPVVAVDSRNGWQAFSVSLHSSASDMLSALLPVSFVPADNDTAPPDLSAGALALQCPPTAAAAAASLAEAIGVPLVSGYGYMLASYSRQDATQSHSNYPGGYVTRTQANLANSGLLADTQFATDLAALPYVKNADTAAQMASLSADDGSQYVSLGATWGSHFVARVVLGDRIFQVFAYKSDKFAQVLSQSGHAAGDRLVGDDAKLMIRYTKDASKGDFGYVDSYGKLTCLSGDAAFTESVTAGQWFDNSWSEGQNSVFTATTFYPDAIQETNFNYTFMTQTVSLATLAPLDVFCESTRATIWRRIIKAEAFVTYRTGVSPNFTNLNDRDFATILPDDQPGLLSALPTPTMDVYKAYLDLADIPIVAPEKVSSFTGVGFVSSLRGVSTLPGKAISLYSGILDAGTSSSANVLTLTDSDALSTIAIGCSSFFGSLLVTIPDNSKWFAICDGLKYQLSDEGYPTVAISVRTSAALASEALSSLYNDFRFAITFAAAVLGVQQPVTSENIPATDSIVREFMQWVSVAIPSTTTSDEMLQLRFRALNLSTFTTDSGVGTNVPILKGEEYEDYVDKLMASLRDITKQIDDIQQLVQQRKALELVISDLSTINSNIVQTGTMLCGFVKQTASQRQAMSEYLETAVTTLKDSIASQQQAIDQLTVALDSAQMDFDNEATSFQNTYDNFEQKQKIFAALGAAQAIFQLGTAIVNPLSGDVSVTNFIKIAKQIKSTYDALNQVAKVYNDADPASKTYKNVQDTLDSMDGGTYGNISELQWENLTDTFNYIMETVPKDIKNAAAALELKFSILRNQAQALTQAQSELQSQQTSLYEKQRFAEFNTEQTSGLNQLVEDFNPDQNIDNFDPSKVDLASMTSMLTLQRNAILADLCQAFLVKDQALQYEYLQSPTIISNYSLLKFDLAQASQAQKTVTAKQKIASDQLSTTTREYTIDTPFMLSQMINGSTSSLRIHTDNSQFSSYAFCRIMSVIPSLVDASPSSDSGRYALRLTFDQTPYSDVDKSGTISSFHTISRTKTYEYMNDGTPVFTHDDSYTWSNDVNPITPFGDWIIDFPAVDINNGLSFESQSLTLKLTFVLQHYYRDSAPEREVENSSLLSTAIPGPLMAPDASTEYSQPDESTLIKSMNSSGSVTNNWDVVFTMQSDAINNALKQQHADLQSESGFDSNFKASTKSRQLAPEEYNISLDSVFYDVPEFYSVSTIVPALKIPISTGNIVQTTTQEGKDPFVEQASLASMTLVANILPTASSDNKNYVFTLGKNDSLSWLEVDPVDGLYTIEGVQITTAHMAGLFTAITTFFLENEIEFTIPVSDVVPSTNIDAMNAIVTTQYNDIIMKKDVKNSIIASYEDDTPATYTVRDFDLTLGYPFLKFDPTKSSDVSVSMDIVSGTVTTSTLVGDDTTNTQTEDVTGTIEGNATLTSIIGSLGDEDDTNVQSVVLDMTSGAYTAANISAQLSPDEDGQLGMNVEQLFQTNDTKYLINKIDFSSESVIDDMRPNQFRFKQNKTPAGVQTLMVFIMTGNRSLLPTGTMSLYNTPESLPQGSTASIFIRSQLLYQSILPTVLTSSWTAEGVQDNSNTYKGHPPWYVRITKAVVTDTNVNLSSLNDSGSTAYGSFTDTFYVDNNTISLDLGSSSDDALTIKSDNDGKMKLYGKKEFSGNDAIKVHDYSTNTPADGKKTSDDNIIDVTLTTTVSAVMRMVVSGSGVEQSLKTNVTAQDVGTTGDSSTDGCNNPTLANQVSGGLISNLQPVIVSSTNNVSFSAISLFAIKNLLFYKTNYINLATSAVPGDVAVFGTFENDDSDVINGSS